MGSSIVQLFSNKKAAGVTAQVGEHWKRDVLTLSLFQDLEKQSSVEEIMKTQNFICRYAEECLIV